MHTVVYTILDSICNVVQATIFLLNMHTNTKSNTMYASNVVDWLFSILLLSLSRIYPLFFIRPLRADRELSIKCFIIMSCSLNFVQVPLACGIMCWLFLCIGACVCVCVSERARLFLIATRKYFTLPLKQYVK